MNESMKSRLFDGSVCLFIFFIPVYSSLSTWFLFVALVMGLLFMRPKHPVQVWVSQGWDLLIYFLVLCMGMLYTQDLVAGWSVLEKSLSLLAVPLLISRSEHDSSGKWMAWFTAGVIAACMLCLAYAAWRSVPDGFYYYELTSVIGLQPTYLAYYISFSLIYLLDLAFYRPAARQPWWIIAAIIFLSSVLMLTAGRTTYISMLLVFAFFALKLLFEPFPMRMKLQGISVAVLLGVIVLFQSPYARRILPQVLSGTHTLDKIKGDSWNRLVLWQSALDAQPNIMLGTGTGDDTAVMNAYFESHGHPEFAEANFNAHNQYIQSLFSNGIPGLVSLLIMLIRPLRLAVSRQHVFGILTFFPFLMYGVSEVFMGRYQGIIFFVLLHQLFLKHYLTVPPRVTASAV